MIIQAGVTEQMRSLLEENGIDVDRVRRCSILHDVDEVVTEITVTLLAKKPERAED